MKDLEKLIHNVRWLNTYDDETFLNFYYARLIKDYRSLFQFQSVADDFDAFLHSRTRNYQRHEQCIDLLENYFPYTMPAIISELIDEETKKLVQVTFDRVVMQMKNYFDKLNISDTQKIAMKVKIDDYLEKNYLTALLPQLEPNDELKMFLESFNENDTIIKLVMHGEKFKESHLRISGSQETLKKYRYALKYISYPYLHPDRPRYMIDAHLAVTIAKSLKQYKFEPFNEINEYGFVYESYAAWDDEMQIDQPLPGLKFDNKQMFWISLTHMRCFKRKEIAEMADEQFTKDPYVGSVDEMKQVFGCETHPGFIIYLLYMDEPKFEFLDEKSFADWGLKVSTITGTADI